RKVRAARWWRSFPLYKRLRMAKVARMKKRLWIFGAVLLCVLMVVVPMVQAGITSSSSSSKSPGKANPGIEAAQTLSMITGVAISPLLGVGAVGAWKYFETPEDKRANLVWY